MKWVPDRTGRFPQRPHYDPAEVDYECEAFMAKFLQSKYGVVKYPVTTNDLAILVEQETIDFDLYADLGQDDEVQGYTDFFRRKKPKVGISSLLSEQEWRENRLRTTITHELGHVKFHNFLFSLPQSIPMSLAPNDTPAFSQRCKRGTLLEARTADWMEWQAGYASGAFLMPLGSLRRVAEGLIKDKGAFVPISLQAQVSQDLIELVQRSFQVSADAARVRLLKLGYLTGQKPSPSLFLPDTY